MPEESVHEEELVAPRLTETNIDRLQHEATQKQDDALYSNLTSYL